MKRKPKTIEIELSRLIPASVIEAFDSWLDPEFSGSPWMDAAQLIFDPKVDGLYYWLFSTPSGEEKPHYGRFTILERPSKVQYTWMSAHTYGLESLVTVTFQETGSHTLVTLRHENLPDDEYGWGHEAGWSFLLSRFGDHFVSA